jgi:uncharacterized protein YndB with AHSA1/START domain
VRTLFDTSLRIGGAGESRRVTADSDYLAPIEILDPRNDERLVLTLDESKALRKALKRAEKAARAYANA